MTHRYITSVRLRSYRFMLVPVVFLISAFSLSANAATSSGLFSAVTSITASVPAYSYLGYAQNGGAAFSADGHTVLVSAAWAPVGATANAGKAFIYHYANGQWAQAAEIDDPDIAVGNFDLFGLAVAMSADGTAALIGSYATVGGKTNAGKAYLYTLSNGIWRQAHEFDDPAPVGVDGFGGSGVSISAHGKTVAMSAPYKTVNSNSEAGEVYVYSNVNGAWSQTAAIPDPNGAQSDEFGHALSLAADGTSLLAGSQAAVNGQRYAGKAYLYTPSNGNWTLAHEFDDPNATAYDRFSYADGVSLSADGQTAVIGAFDATSSATNSGAAYVYSHTSGSWTQTATVADPDATTSDQFGWPVAISGNGQSVLIGSVAPPSGTYTYAGKAYSFVLNSGTWTQTHEFDDPAATSRDFFSNTGVALSADGQSAFITASNTAVNGQPDVGVAYIYQSPANLSLALSPRYPSLQQYSTESLDATVTNNATDVTASNVVLSFNIPAGLNYIGGNAGNGTCSQSGQTATCTLASLAPGAVWQPTVLATAAKTGTVTGTATVTSNEPDPATSNNAASASVTVTAYPKNTNSGGGGSGSSGGGGLGLGVLAALGLLMLAGIKRRR